METTTFDKEWEIASREGIFVVGVDEVGRGPLCGPVVAAAVCYKDSSFAIPVGLEKEFALIRDSKKLSAKQREQIFVVIQEHFYVGVGLANVETIDRVNILQATFLAMKSAISQLTKKLPTTISLYHGIPENNGHGFRVHLLIDGNQELPSYSGLQEAVIGGDGIVKSIAAASIIAKVTRDRMMDVYETEYPGYGFAKHKGYGTAEHMKALRKLGPCPIHRLSFKPVLLSLPENVNKRFAHVLKPKRK